MFRRTVLTTIVATAFLPLFTNAQVKYVEGVDYLTLKTPIETTSSPKVIEFFWFACPHCNALRPALEKWLTDGKPKDIAFEYVPATFDSQQWALPAQAYYTMQNLGKEEELFNAYFDEIFVKRNRGMIAAVPEIKKFFVKNGVSPEDFDKAWNSFAVKQKLQRAAELFQNSGLDGVPAFVVNGTYIVQPQGDGQAAYDRAFDIIKTLSSKGLVVAKESDASKPADSDTSKASEGDASKASEGDASKASEGDASKAATSTLPAPASATDAKN